MKTLYIYNFLNSLKKVDLVAALIEGAKRYGYEHKIMTAKPTTIDPSDILVIWNRHINQDQFAKAFEDAGALVWVFENPYIKLPGYYAFGLGIHNSMNHAIIPRDKGERWQSFGMEIKSWKQEQPNGKILIASQSRGYDKIGIGLRAWAQPVGWDSQIKRSIAKATNREINFRQHPAMLKNNPELIVPLSDDFRDTYATVVYTSNAATDSLLEGIPVCYLGPSVMMADCCNKGIDKIENLKRPDNREEIFHKLAWGQFNEDEIKASVLFEILC